MRKHFYLVVALIFVTPLMADPEFRGSAAQKMEQFKKAHPGVMYHSSQYFDLEGFIEIDGTANMMYGSPMSHGNSPTQSGWNLCEQLEGIYAEEIGTLVPGQEIGVMWNKKTQSYKFTTFRFQQTVQGIPVYKSGNWFSRSK